MKNYKNVQEIILYFVFGGLTTIINIIIYYIMIKSGIHYIASTILSFAIAATISYYFNKKWVFLLEDNKKEKQRFMKYVFVRIASISLDSILLLIAVEFLKQNQLISKIFISGGIILLTYSVNKLFVFQKG